MQHAVAKVNTLSQKSYSIEALELLRNDIFYHKNSKRILSTHIIFKLLAGRYLECPFCKVSQERLGEEMISFGYKKTLTSRQIKTLKSRLVNAGLLTASRDHNRTSYSYALTPLGEAAYYYFVTPKEKIHLELIKTSPQIEKTSPQKNIETPMIPGGSQKNFPCIPYPYSYTKNNIRSNAEPKVKLPEDRTRSSFFDLERLGVYGFGRLQDRQLNSLGLDKKVVQDSIDAFADAMERNSKFEKSVLCKISYFMAMMRRDGVFARLVKNEIKIETPEQVVRRKNIEYVQEHGDGRFDEFINKTPELKAENVKREISELLRDLVGKQAVNVKQVMIQI